MKKLIGRMVMVLCALVGIAAIMIGCESEQRVHTETQTSTVIEEGETIW